MLIRTLVKSIAVSRVAGVEQRQGRNASGLMLRIAGGEAARWSVTAYFVQVTECTTIIQIITES